jgi:hypothetical protein
MPKKISKLFILLCFFFSACNRIETADTLSPGIINNLKNMGLLNAKEGLVCYYSNYKEEIVGSIIANQRLAHYWIDEKDSSKSEIESAYYSEIVNIVDHFQMQDFDCPYLEVTKSDSTQFRVYVDGNEEEKQHFYQTALALWKQKLKK